MGSRGDDYKFLRLIDAISSINQKVNNLIGIVVETSIPEPSKDCFCTVRIVDESKVYPGISVNFFTETIENLPQVESVGDNIQLTRVLMKIHGSEVYAVFNKKLSSFPLFERRNGTGFVPYQFSAKYHTGVQDEKFITGLRKWSVDHKDDIVSCRGCGIQPMKDIKEGEHFNLACKKMKEKTHFLCNWNELFCPEMCCVAFRLSVLF